MSDIAFKKSVYDACEWELKQRSERLYKRSGALQQDLGRVSKSSAGDKHETGRAMLQLELEKLSGQIQHVHQQKRLLQSITYHKVSLEVTSGSLLKLADKWFFVCLGIGVIHINERNVYCLAPSAPIG